MGIEYDISDVEKITIRITDSVSNESLHEFMAIYVTILTSLQKLEQKRTLHILSAAMHPSVLILVICWRYIVFFTINVKT